MIGLNIVINCTHVPDDGLGYIVAHSSSEVRVSATVEQAETILTLAGKNNHMWYEGTCERCGHAITWKAGDGE